MYPVLGSEPLDQIARADLQEIVHTLASEGLAPTTIETTANAVRAIYRHEVDCHRIKVNPTRGLKLPTGSSRRERIADPVEARALLGAVPVEDRAIWATAPYAGLRRGELRALRAGSIDLDAGEIHVHAGWDPVEGRQATKGRERRVVPIIGELRRSAPNALKYRADRAWKAAGLRRITPHECRHSFASIAIAAGVTSVRCRRRLATPASRSRGTAITTSCRARWTRPQT